MPITDFTRIAVSGATIDGRIIQPEWLTEATANYDPENIYTARINAEHITGLRPNGDYPAYGQIVELKTEEITVSIDGVDTPQTALLARLDVNDKAVALNKDDQKVFSSIEVAPDFAGSGSAYIVGMALTDTPASLGCERLTFSKGKNEPSNVASKAAEVQLKFAKDDKGTGDASGDVKTLTSAITGGIDKLTALLSNKPKDEPKKPPENAPAADANDAKFAALAEGLTEIGKGIGSFSTAVIDRLDASDAAQAELKSIINETPADRIERNRATGGGASGKKHPGF